jgi:hypothetical protein
MFNADNYLITIAEVKGFTLAADAVLSSAEREALTDFLAMHPLAGEVIPDTGGVRRIKWPALSQGRRSGARIIYFFRDLNTPVYLLALYGKGERVQLSAREKCEIRNLVLEIVEEYGLQRAVQFASHGAA